MDYSFPTDYQQILNRVDNINPLKYAKTRNFINGQITYLSPYISRGVISSRQVLDLVLKKGFSLYESEKLIQELAWREYFQRVWQAKKEHIWNDLKEDQSDVLHHNMIASIQNAQTGIDIIDKQILQLYKNGYLHNHIRMYLAAISCNIGKAHWLAPSKWMYYHLLDGDIASNNCSWQWVAGAFSSKKYYCNQENINKYCFSKQTQTFLDKTYEDIAEMDLPSELMQNQALELNTLLPHTTIPIIDTSIPTLIYNSYNVDPLWRKEDKVNRILILEPSHFKQYPVSEKVIDFIIDLSHNIEGIKVYIGELDAISNIYKDALQDPQKNIISKEHPLFEYYPGIKDEREWMFPEVTGYYPSFFAYWKKCEKRLKALAR